MKRFTLHLLQIAFYWLLTAVLFIAFVVRPGMMARYYQALEGVFTGVLTDTDGMQNQAKSIQEGKSGNGKKS